MKSAALRLAMLMTVFALPSTLSAADKPTEKNIITVFYEGAFRCPGSLAVKEGVTVIEAIKLNGGLKPGNWTGVGVTVQLKRMSADETPTVRTLNLARLAESPDNVQLKNGDTLMVADPSPQSRRR